MGGGDRGGGGEEGGEEGLGAGGGGVGEGAFRAGDGDGVVGRLGCGIRDGGESAWFFAKVGMGRWRLRSGQKQFR